ncbi:ribosome biogenesis protein ytm1 [Rhizophlyctis rosea]|uniref:Ribosome biogenesis protein ytm1 n=1 Tax=Rhizophlyctis rosea TaxID=64517 RepID=A0AAD5X3C7_9FUNG|nr:ribosome biogenesis protein ytm1 [Rhizophlyctis rosea]
MADPAIQRDSNPKAEAQVQVRFHTKQQKYAITDAPILVPSRLRRYGLSEIVNHLLAAAKPIPFDFLIDGKFIRTSLQAYLDAHNLSTENVLDVEYLESTLPPTQAGSIKHDDWICAVKASRKSPFIATGSYDANARIWDRAGNCVATLQGHEGAVKSIAWINETQDQPVRLLSGGLDQQVMGWEYSNDDNKSRLIFTCAEQTGSVESIAVNVAQSHFAAATYGGSINVWSIANGDDDDDEQEEDEPRKRRRTDGRRIPVKRAMAILDAHVGAVSSVVFDQDATHGSKLYSGGWDHSVRNCETISCVYGIRAFKRVLP